MDLGVFRYAVLVEKENKYYELIKKLLKRYLLKENKKEAEKALNRCGFEIVKN